MKRFVLDDKCKHKGKRYEIVKLGKEDGLSFAIIIMAERIFIHSFQCI